MTSLRSKENVERSPVARTDVPSSPALAPTDHARVLYIGGLGRSGSTLLDRMLGQIPGFLSTGELRDLWLRGVLENRLCGCGTPFLECTFWARVSDRAFGGWDVLDLPDILARQRRLDRHLRLLFLLHPRVAPARFRRDLATHTALLSRLYRSLAAEDDVDVIVDSSKAPSYAALLRQVPDIDLRVLHLVRDSRGTAYSWYKHVERPDVVERTAHMARYHPFRIALRWVTRNLFMEWFRWRYVEGAFLRYDVLVAEPRASVADAAALGGLPSTSTTPHLDRFIRGDQVALTSSHTVQGNPMRMQSGWIPLQLDDWWRTAMRPWHRVLVTVLTWPVLRRYGYRR